MWKSSNCYQLAMMDKCLPVVFLGGIVQLESLATNLTFPYYRFTILILAVVAFLVLQNKGYYVFLNVWKFHLWISMIIPKIEIKKKNC